MTDQFTTPRRKTFGELPIDTISSVTTAATGTNYTALPSLNGCRIVRFMNPTTALEVRKVGGTATIKAPANAETLVYVANNSNELEVRRADTSNTQEVAGLLLGGY